MMNFDILFFSYLHKLPFYFHENEQTCLVEWQKHVISILKRLSQKDQELVWRTC